MKRIAYAVSLLVIGLLVIVFLIEINIKLSFLLVVTLIFLIIKPWLDYLSFREETIADILAEAKVLAEMESRKQPALMATIFPVALNEERYVINVQNVSQIALHDIEIDFFNILGPDAFGFDPTHMPSSMTDEPKFIAGNLLSNESLEIELEKWGRLTDYKRSMDQQVEAKFRTDANLNDSTYSHTVPVRIVNERPTKNVGELTCSDRTTSPKNPSTPPPS